MTAAVHITKASGDRQLFSEEKLLASLRRAGADDAAARRVLDEVKKQLFDGMPSRKIYRVAFELLKAESRSVAARYHLKQALMELGPSGYPFERYIGDLLQFEGYRTEVGKILEGKCVRHEVDVVARNTRELIVVECKYHNYAGVSCDVKVPLYIYARYQDILAAGKNDAAKITQCWVLTNTRFTSDALAYAACVGLVTVGWSYPEDKGLKDRIDRLGLYPLTCMTSLTMAEKEKLIARGVILCGELQDNGKLLRSLKVSPERAMLILNEADELCSCPAIPAGSAAMQAAAARSRSTAAQPVRE